MDGITGSFEWNFGTEDLGEGALMLVRWFVDL